VAISRFTDVAVGRVKKLMYLEYIASARGAAPPHQRGDGGEGSRRCGGREEEGGRGVDLGCEAGSLCAEEASCSF
jgi:hypothetical protein